MFCPNCGSQQLNEDAVFCNNCGSPLRPFTTQAAPAPQGAPNQAQPAQQMPPAQQAAPVQQGAPGQMPAPDQMTMLGQMPAPGQMPSAYAGPAPQANAQQPAQMPYAAPANQPPYAAAPPAQAPQSPQPPQGSGGPNKKLIIGIAAGAVALIAIIIGVVVFLGQGSSAPAGSASASSSAASPSSGAAPQSGMQFIGSEMVGQMQVPTSWVDRGSTDLDPRTIQDYGMVYYADPASEYKSNAMGHSAYGKSIQLSIWNTDYVSVAKTASDDYKSDPTMYSDVEVGETTFNGYNAMMISAYVPADNQQVLEIILDRDGNGTAAVRLKANCGTDAAQAEEVLGYISTWKF